MGKIAELQKKLQELQAKLVNAVNQSIIWVQKQIAKIQAKIMEYVNKATKWLTDKLQQAQAWMDGIKEEITNYIIKLLMAPVLAMAGGL
jgi:predicted PurR-regulated permease PerM